MAAEWREERVADLQAAGALLVEDGNHGEYRPRQDEFVEDGVAFIRAADMEAGTIRFGSASRIGGAALARIRKGIGTPGDVLLSHKGTVGKVALAELDCEPFVCSPQTTFWRVLDTAVLDRRYLYYYLCSRHFRKQLDARKGETDMADYVSLTTQRRLRVLLPPIAEQRAVARVLGCLDDKIELNRRMNETLEAMAQAIFRSWFVDFDPVRAKAEGRQPVGMDAATAALFPDSFEESALGETPRGWRVGSVGDATQVVGGTTPSTKEPAYWNDGTVHFATPRDLSTLAVPVLIDTERCITERGVGRIPSGVLPKGTVLMSSRAPVGYLAITEVPVTVNQGMIAMVCNRALPNHYVLRWAQANMSVIESRTTGTTFGEVTKRDFRPLPCLVPTAPVLSAFAKLVAPLHERIVLSLRESRTLAAIRDALLPKLMSGEVRVGEAERATGAQHE